MKKYDVIVIGASTTGCRFAERMAQNGFRTMVIEKEQPDDVSRSYDIFHMGEGEMKQFGLDIPEEGDSVREFRFTSSPMISPYGNHPKQGGELPVIGLHKHDYIMRMAENAKKSGAKILYGAKFTRLLYDEKGRVAGCEYETADGTQQAYARIVSDCSGIPAVARTSLPDTSAVENFRLTPIDIFYVVLYYVDYVDKSINPRDLDGFFMQYKSWSAPAGKDYDAILGIGGSYSYAYSEQVFNTQFMKNVSFPEYTVRKMERGMTPWHRTLYSFVDDGFIAMGDAACLTKPTCGEGCTSSLVQVEIAVEVISQLLKYGDFLTRERLWSINTRYMKAQGKDFDSMRPLLMGLVSMSLDEAEYLFENDVIFSQKILGGMSDGLVIEASDVTDMLKGVARGIARKKFRAETLGRILKGLAQMIRVGTLYDAYPETPDGFEEWKTKADRLWAEIGTLANTCDPEIKEKLGIE